VAKVFLDWLDRGYSDCIARGFDFVGGLPSGLRVCIKPNLTFPYYKQGVMTNPEALQALLEYLKDCSSRITVCESDSGGYNRFSMDEVFERTGIRDLARRYGVTIVNASFAEARTLRVPHWTGALEVPLPAFVLEDTDLFITMPVPKVHLNTGVSLSMKNQWGLIRDPGLRLQLHPYFNKVIYWINKSLPKTYCVVDGKYGLTRSGPLRGDPVELNWLVVGDSVFHTDLVLTDLMGIHWTRVPHIRYAVKREGIRFPNDVKLSVNHSSFKQESFYLRREWTDYPGFLAFHSRLLAFIGYESFLAKPLHWLLYRFREPFY